MEPRHPGDGADQRWPPSRATRRRGRAPARPSAARPPRRASSTSRPSFVSSRRPERARAAARRGGARPRCRRRRRARRAGRAAAGRPTAQRARPSSSTGSASSGSVLPARPRARAAGAGTPCTGCSRKLHQVVQVDLGLVVRRAAARRGTAGRPRAARPGPAPRRAPRVEAERAPGARVGDEVAGANGCSGCRCTTWARALPPSTGRWRRGRRAAPPAGPRAGAARRCARRPRSGRRRGARWPR